jgi:hypothetical protein
MGTDGAPRAKRLRPRGSHARVTLGNVGDHGPHESPP